MDEINSEKFISKTKFSLVFNFILVIMLIVATIISSRDYVFCESDHEITSLPGLSKKPSFRQYSGYLNGGQDIHLHYWFVESQANPKEDPVILWLNGGPGESSLWGLFAENGPLRVGSDGQTLTLDPNSWNTLANVLYLETPVGIGFSYYSGTKSLIYSDETTVAMNLNAIQNFFAMFPQFSNNSFYIAGESYGGVYATTLGLNILKNDNRINLKGISIGNSLLDDTLRHDYAVRFAYYHGFIDTQTWDNWTLKHCITTESGQMCDYSQEFDSLDLGIFDKINIYNIDDNICSIIKYNESDISFGINSGKIFEGCPPDTIKIYLNLAEVRKALHIPKRVKKWRTASSLNYHWTKSIKSVIKEIIKTNKLDTFIVYNGDLDILCDFLGSHRFVDSLGLKLKEKYKPWKLNRRIGGFVKRYEGITFTTIRGAGHSVPMDRPDAGLAILKELIGVSKLN